VLEVQIQVTPAAIFWHSVRHQSSINVPANAMDDITNLKRILKSSHVIAVVGLSANWWRPSYFVAKYLQDHGYRVIPVNPAYQEVLGEKCYASLKDVPEKIDMVDCFRNSADIPPIATEAVQIKAQVLWMQLGIENEAAKVEAEAAGMAVVENRCLLIEHRRFKHLL
jgi:predicted CoA-binding protein